MISQLAKQTLIVMITEHVTRNRVNVVALMDTLEPLAKCLVSAFQSIVLNDFLYHFNSKYSPY